MNVLTVEDDLVLANVIGRNLIARGHQARHAETGADALSQLSQQRPDAIILDVNLPDSSGWDLLRRLDECNRAAIRVIVVSAAPISLKRLLEFRPRGHLQKPFAIGSLMNLIEQASDVGDQQLDTTKATIQQ